MTEEATQQGNTEQGAEAEPSTAKADETEQLLTGQTEEKSEGTTKSESSESEAEGEEASGELEDTDYDLSVPEGFPDENTELVSEFCAVAKDQGLTKEQAQGAVDWFAAKQKAAIEKFQLDQEQKSKSWVAELKSDPDFGASNYTKTLKQANVALEKFGGKDAVEAITAAGLANNPALVKLFARVHSALAEDSLAEGKPVAEDTVEAKLSKLYPGI
jgi:hypothetical protein